MYATAACPFCQSAERLLIAKGAAIEKIRIDLEPERYKHYFLKELPEKYHDMIDVGAFGPGERLVFEPYTREMFEQTHRWMEQEKLFPEGQVGAPDYDRAVSAHG